MSNTESFGEVTRSPGYVTAVMERFTEASPSEVWAMLAEESNRVKWLAPGSIDLEKGGRAVLDFKDSYVMVDSEVKECVPESTLEFSWSGGEDPERPVRWQLSKTDSGTWIHFSVSIPETEVVARSFAGWEAHLTMLEAALAGVSIKFPLERFQEARAYFDAEVENSLMANYSFVTL